MEQTQRERLKDLIVKLGLSIRQFEIAIGASSGTISHMGEMISGNLLTKITVTFPQVNKTWLLTGIGSEFSTGDNVVNNAFATGGSAASVYGNATVGAQTSEDDKKRIAELEAEVQELKARIYDLMIKK